MTMVSRTKDVAAKPPKDTPAGVKTLLAAALAAVFLAAIDQNIVGTALPLITRELGGIHLYPWVFTAYMLASTLAVPITGKLGDQYGRKRVLLAGIAVFLVGSIACGAAVGMPMLLAGRVAQGLGAGAMTSNSFALVGDIFPPSERGRYTGLFTGVYALAGLIGPLLGGTIADTIGWRGVFLINVPVGIAAGAIILFAFRVPARHRSGSPLDWAGALTFTVAILSLLLVLPARGGATKLDALRLPALLAGGMALLVFFVVERRAKAPLIPFALFRRPVFALAIGATFLYGASLHSMGAFVPLLLQGVQGQSAMNAGLSLVPMTTALVVGSVAGGQLVTRLGKYRWISTVGLVLASSGTYALSLIDAASPTRRTMLGVGVVGLGIGLTLPALSVSAQNAAPQRDLGSSSSLVHFARSLGGSIGIALLGALFSSTLDRGMVPALSRVFVTATVILAVAAGISTLLTDVPLRRTLDDEEGRPAEEKR